MSNTLWALAEHRHGLLFRHEAIPLLGERRLDRMLARGRLEAVGSGVYRVPGSPRTPEQSLLAAVGAAGLDCAVAAGRSAGWLWGLVDDPPPAPEVMVPNGRRRRLTGVRIVESLDCTPEWKIQRRGIPTLNPILTMVELARVLDREAFADSLERGLGLFSMSAMWSILDTHGRSGRRGIARLRVVVNNRALGEKPSDSLVEERCAGVLTAAGISGWSFHHAIRDERGAFVAEPDFAFERFRLGIEIDGAGKFRQRGYLDHFAERRHRVRELGWDLEHFTWAHVVSRPSYFTSTVQRLIAQRAETPNVSTSRAVLRAAGLGRCVRLGRAGGRAGPVQAWEARSSRSAGRMTLSVWLRGSSSTTFTTTGTL